MASILSIGRRVHRSQIRFVSPRVLYDATRFDGGHRKSERGEKARIACTRREGEREERGVARVGRERIRGVWEGGGGKERIPFAERREAKGRKVSCCN